MTPVNPPEVVVCAFSLFPKKIATRSVDNSKRVGRDLIEPPQQIRSEQDQKLADSHHTPTLAGLCIAEPIVRPNRILAPRYGFLGIRESAGMPVSGIQKSGVC